MQKLPMFPLGSVLLPGGALPLHVFEPRYQALVRDCLDAPEHEFGTVLIDRGSEVGGGDVRRDVGVVARMVQVAQLADDRFAVVAVGHSRIRVVEWLPDNPYPRAVVEHWPDANDNDNDNDNDDAVDADLRADVIARSQRLATQIGISVEIPEDADAFTVTEAIPVGPADRFAVLCASGTAERWRILDRVVADVTAAMTFRTE